jgi:hypothetical protein
MIKFLIILSIIWGILSIGGWIGVVPRINATPSLRARIIGNIYEWSILLDLLTIAFWVWLMNR